MLDPETTDEPEVDWKPAPGAVWAARDPDLADQPPEVDDLEPGGPTSLPPAQAAAERVNAFLSWFGDGIVLGPWQLDASEVNPAETPPTLYARDLAALAELAGRIRTRTSWAVVRNGSSYMGYGDRDTSEAFARADYDRRVKTLHVGESLRLEKTTVTETYQAQTTVVDSRTKT